MANLTFDEYLELLDRGIYRQVAKIQLLRLEDFSVIQEITGDIENESGSLDVQKANGLRRSCSFTLINKTINDINPKYIPEIGGLITPRRPFRLWLGLIDEENNEYITEQGIFILDDPVVDSTSSSSTVKIKGLDPSCLFDGTLGGNLNRTYIISVGTNIYTAINSILELEGYPLKPILDSSFSSETTPYTITTSTNDSYFTIFNQLADMLAANVYFNNQGSLVIERDTDDSIKGSSFDFTTDKFQYLGATCTDKYSKIYNSVLVIGANANNGILYDAESTNTNLLSSTSVQNLGYKRQYKYEDSNIYTEEGAKALADYILKRLISAQKEVSINCIPIYHLQPDEIITLTDSKLGLYKERFLITSFSIPFQTGGQMSISGVKAVDLPFVDVP